MLLAASAMRIASADQEDKHSWRMAVPRLGIDLRATCRSNAKDLFLTCSSSHNTVPNVPKEFGEINAMLLED